MTTDKESVIIRIYELRDPRVVETFAGESTRYIGKTVRSLSVRLYEHIHDSLNRKHHRVYRFNWIKNLIEFGESPTIHLIEEVVGFDYGHEVEKYWISEFKEYGSKLTNHTDGGGGALGYVPSEKDRIKTSNRNKELWADGAFDKNRKTIYQFKIDGTFVAKYDSISEAARAVNINSSCISNMMSGNTKHVFENVWSFTDVCPPLPTKYQHRAGVYQCDMLGNIIEKWKTIKDACNALNVNRVSIRNNLNGKAKHAGGFIWKYVSYEDR